MPLVRSWWLGKKKGKEAYVVPHVVDRHGCAQRAARRFEIGHDPSKGATPDSDGTVARTAAVCLACEAAVPLSYVRS